MPPLSAIFSPCVFTPLICAPTSLTVQRLYWSKIQLNFFIDNEVYSRQTIYRCDTNEFFTNKTFCSLMEAIDIFVFPPPVQITILIEQSTLVVETMGNFMTDHYTDSSVIQALWKVSVIKGRLQYARWKHQDGRIQNEKCNQFH